MKRRGFRAKPKRVIVLPEDLAAMSGPVILINASDVVKRTLAAVERLGYATAEQMRDALQAELAKLK